MPLPAALAARLAKRGLVNSSAKDTEPEKLEPEPAAVSGEEEEVFAESYDDPDLTSAHDDAAPPTHLPTMDQQYDDDDMDDEPLIYEVSGCPNKQNQFHECSAFCSEKWGLKPFDPNPSNERKRVHMLKKYPLPENWEEVGDPSTNRHYYWNTLTDEVSWLPPTHPRTHVSLPADRLKELHKGVSDDLGSDGEEDIMDIDDFEEIERKILMEKSVKDKEKKREKKKREEPLDPMDPASYSEIGRGTWSSGLEMKGSAKTGVDSTASGPLFQQRPYPSPGAILRLNQGKD